jgi:hypothetical protein
MSSYDSVESTDAGIQLWRVQLGTGEIRAMSLDALDDAFQAGTIDGATPVIAPGSTVWAKLAHAAGLDVAAPGSAVNSSASVAVSVDDSQATGPARAYIVRSPQESLQDIDLDSLEFDAFKAKKGRVYIAMGLAVMAFGGLGFAATQLPPVTPSAANARSAEPARKVAAAAPPQAQEDENAARRLKALTEEQRIRLLEADKAREAAKRKDRSVSSANRSGLQPKSAAPSVNGGSKYDPLNGAF